MKKMWQGLLLLLSAALCGQAVHAQEAYRHTVERGDTLYDLAIQFFRRPADAGAVARLNKVRDPRRLRVGFVLVIPRAFLKSSVLDAKVLAYKGSVVIRRTGGRTANAQIGTRVAEGETIETGRNSFVTLGIGSSAKTTLPSFSKVRVTRMRRYAVDNYLDRAFYLLNGRSEWDAGSMKKAKGRLSVETPTATSAVRGTQFRVAFDEAASATAVTVTEGRVAVSPPRPEGEGAAGPDDGRAIGKGFGVVADHSGLAEPAPLLAKPGLVEPSRLQNKRDLQFSAEPTPGASAYYFRIGRDAGMIDNIAEVKSQAAGATFDGLPDGIYYLRISAVDENGLEGLDRTYSFRRLHSDIGHPKAHREQDKTLFSWIDEGSGGPTRFILSRNRHLAAPLLDRVGLSSPFIAITGLEPGTYYWAVEKIVFGEGPPTFVRAPVSELVISRE